VKNEASVSTDGKETYKANNDDSVKTTVSLPPTGDRTEPFVIVAMIAIAFGGIVLAGSRRRRTV